MLRTFLFACLAPLAACHLSFGDHVIVDGVRLPAKHEEVLTLESWPAGGLEIAAHVGDLSVEHGDGPITLTVTLLEREPGEAHAEFEGGKLVARAANGATCALGGVRVRTASAPGGLDLSTGVGDVRVDGVGVTGRLKVSTGTGDVDVRAAGEPDAIELATGVGDVSVSDVRCTRFAARTGTGDVSVRGLEASEDSELSSGLGDVQVARSKGKRVKANTGLGDVDLVESSFEKRELDTGLGRVREH